MLAIAWAATGWLLRRCAVPGALGAARSRCPPATLLLLFAGEAALAAALSGTRPAAWLAGFARPRVLAGPRRAGSPPG